MDEIQLRDRETGKEIRGVIETDEPVIAIEQIAYAPGGRSFHIEEYGSTLDFDYCGENKTDDYGNNLYLDSDCQQVPEHRVEPYVDGMSEKQFTDIGVKLNVLCKAEDVSKVRGLIDDALGRLEHELHEYMDGAVLTLKPEIRANTINATQMALAVTGNTPSHKYLEPFGITEHGRDEEPNPYAGKDE